MTSDRPGPDTGGREWPVEVLTPYPAAPGLLFGRCAARSPDFGPNAAAGGQPVIIGSAAGREVVDVSRRARGELSERAGNILAGRRAEAAAEVVSSYDRLRARGVPSLDPATLLTDRDVGVRSATMMWVTGSILPGGEEVLVPAGAVHLRHRPPPGAVAGVSAGSTGLAAHPEVRTAVRHAALEVAERELLVRAWYDVGVRPVALGDGARPSDAVAIVLEQLRLRVRLWTVAGLGPLRCVLACVCDADGGGQAFGARCVPAPHGAVPVAALDAAVHEALMVRWSMATPSAGRARRALGERGSGPRNTVEHAVCAYDRAYAADHLDARADLAAPEPTTGRAAAAGRAKPPDSVDPVDPVALLAEATGAPVLIATADNHGFSPHGSVVRVIAPGARRLPSVESPGATAPPHPFG